MKITKYPQSCLVIEDSDRRLLIDPGSFVSKKYKISDLLPIDGILVTHQHSDHLDPEFLKNILSINPVPVIGNKATAKTLNNLVTQIVEDSDRINIAGFQITARELPHVAMVDGSSGPQNTGYIIDDIFFHPGDGLMIDALHVENLAAPIAGPDISPRDVFDLIKRVGCNKVIPIHYDGFPADPHFFSDILKKSIPGITILVLEDGQTTEL